MELASCSVAAGRAMNLACVGCWRMCTGMVGSKDWCACAVHACSILECTLPAGVDTSMKK
eukprot:363074-Chlamydomonas_euryale.AAC.8